MGVFEASYFEQGIPQHNVDLERARKIVLGYCFEVVTSVRWTQIVFVFE